MYTLENGYERRFHFVLFAFLSGVLFSIALSLTIILIEIEGILLVAFVVIFFARLLNAFSTRSTHRELNSRLSDVNSKPAPLYANSVNRLMGDIFANSWLTFAFLVFMVLQFWSIYVVFVLAMLVILLLAFHRWLKLVDLVKQTEPKREDSLNKVLESSSKNLVWLLRVEQTSLYASIGAFLIVLLFGLSDFVNSGFALEFHDVVYVGLFLNFVAMVLLAVIYLPGFKPFDNDDKSDGKQPA